MSLLSRLFERRSGLYVPDEWLIDWATGGGKSAAGVHVTPSSAMTCAEVFACIRNIAEDVGKLPLILYRRLQPRGKERERNNPVYALLHDSPNEDMTAFAFRQAVTAHALLYGNGYAGLQRDGRGRVTAMMPLPGNRTLAKRYPDGTLYFEYRDEVGNRYELPSAEVLHVPGFGTDGVVGLMVSSLGKESIGLAIAARKFGAAFFGNGSRSGGVLKHPGKLTVEAQRRLADSWEEKHRGPENAHRVAVLQEGMEYAADTVAPEQAQFLETRQFQVEEVARWFRMPPHKIQQLLRATFSNIEHQSLEYLSDTLTPWLVKWEQEIQRKVLANEPGDLFAEHLVDAILRSDTESRYRAYATGRQWGWLSANDVLEKENLNPIDDGDMYLVPANMMPADQVGQAPAPSITPTPSPDAPSGGDMPDDDIDTPDTMSRAWADLLAQQIRQVLKIESDRTARAKAKPDFPAWVGLFYGDHVAHVRAALGATVDALAESAWACLRREPLPTAIRQQMVGACQAMAERHCTASRKLICDGKPLDDAGRAGDEAEAEVRVLFDLLTTIARGTPCPTTKPVSRPASSSSAR